MAWVQGRANRALSAKNIELTEANSARTRALGKADARLGLAFGAIEQFREAVSTNLDVQNRPENGALRRELLRAPLAFLRTLRDDLHGDPDARLEGRLQLADSQFELARLTSEVGNQDDAQAAAEAAAASLEAMALTSCRRQPARRSAGSISRPWSCWRGSSFPTAAATTRTPPWRRPVHRRGPGRRPAG